MTVVKLNNRPANGFNLLDNFFNEIPTFFKDDFGTKAQGFVPVNVKETKEAYQLEVVAPGFDKNDFNINLERTFLPFQLNGKLIRKIRVRSKFERNTAISRLNALLQSMKRLTLKKLTRNMLTVF